MGACSGVKAEGRCYTDLVKGKEIIVVGYRPQVPREVKRTGVVMADGGCGLIDLGLLFSSS